MDVNTSILLHCSQDRRTSAALLRQTSSIQTYTKFAMDSFGLTMFSILIAVLGYFQPVSLTGISDRLQNGLGKEYVLDPLGMIVDRFLPVLHSNDTLADSELQFDMSSAVVSISSEQEPVGSVMNAPTVNFSASPDDTTGYKTDTVSLIADWNESGSRPFSSNQYLDLATDRPELPEFSSQIRLAVRTLFRYAVLLGPPAIVAAVLLVGFAYCRDLRAADSEIMGFINEIQSKRASLRQKVDLAILIIDQELAETERHILAEQERVHQELTSFRPDAVFSQEVNAFREKLELLIQCEFDRQVSWVKDYLQELQQLRQSLPSSAEIRSQCDEFQETLQQAKDAHNKLTDALKHIDELLDSLSTERRQKAVPLVQDSFSLIDDELHAVRSISSNGESGSSKASEGFRDNAQTQPQPLSQWVMASARRAMTPEEFEKARQIRRQRVKMRCAARPKANSASSYGQSWT